MSDDPSAPTHHTTPWVMPDGTVAMIRPIRPEDEPLVAVFHHGLSERSVYYRYFMTFRLDQRIAHERLERICFADFDHEMVLVAEHADAHDAREIMAIGRLSKVADTNEGEFAVLVSDHWQGHGLGAELLRRLVDIGRERKLLRIRMVMLGDNHTMQHVVRKAGFKVTTDLENNEASAVLELY